MMRLMILNRVVSPLVEHFSQKTFIMVDNVIMEGCYRLHLAFLGACRHHLSTLHLFFLLHMTVHIILALATLGSWLYIIALQFTVQHHRLYWSITYCFPFQAFTFIAFAIYVPLEYSLSSSLSIRRVVLLEPSSLLSILVPPHYLSSFPWTIFPLLSSLNVRHCYHPALCICNIGIVHHYDWTLIVALIQSGVHLIPH